MIAALVFLHPKFTLGALLELLPLYKLHESIVSRAVSICYLVFLTCHIFVPIDPAIQTVVLLAFGASEPDIIFLFEEEHVLAIGSGAPGDGVPIHIGIELESIFLIFRTHLLIEHPFDIGVFELLSALVVGTGERELVLANLGLEALEQAVFMENVLTALQRHELFIIQPHKANIAQNLLVLFPPGSCHLLLFFLKLPCQGLRLFVHHFDLLEKIIIVFLSNVGVIIHLYCVVGHLYCPIKTALLLLQGFGLLSLTIVYLSPISLVRCLISPLYFIQLNFDLNL